MRDRLITEENKKDKSEDGYGYGWGVAHFRGAREISHGGGLQPLSQEKDRGLVARRLRMRDTSATS